MMDMIVTLFIMGMLLQGVIAVLDSVLDLSCVVVMLKGLPLIGANLSLLWAYLFVVITDVGGTVGADWGVATEVLSMGSFGADIGLAIIILAFGPIKDAAVSALGKGLGR